MCHTTRVPWETFRAAAAAAHLWVLEGPDELLYGELVDEGLKRLGVVLGQRVVHVKADLMVGHGKR